MSAKDDGGSAFPRSPHSGDASDDGMTLRDWFAGMALQGMLAGNENARYDLLGSRAYSHADDMLRERAK